MSFQNWWGHACGFMYNTDSILAVHNVWSRLDDFLLCILLGFRWLNMEIKIMNQKIPNSYTTHGSDLAFLGQGGWLPLLAIIFVWIYFNFKRISSDWWGLTLELAATMQFKLLFLLFPTLVITTTTLSPTHFLLTRRSHSFPVPDVANLPPL